MAFTFVNDYDDKILDSVVAVALARSPFSGIGKPWPSPALPSYHDKILESPLIVALACISFRLPRRMNEVS